MLHFNYYNTDIHRTEYFEKLSEIFKLYNLDKYEKNNKKIFKILMKFGDINEAIKRAKRLCRENEGKQPSKMKPATKVYELIEALLPHIV